MKILNLISQLGDRATRSDLWTLCAIVAFIWALIKWDTEIMLWIMGFMFADLGVEKVTDVQKVKHYAENIRKDQSRPRRVNLSNRNNSDAVDKDNTSPE